MSFFRTDEGIANQAVFLKRKFVVYVEEEPNLDSARSVDIPHWNRYFCSSFGDGIFEFRGLGGKPFVMEMADRIIQGDIKNVLCAVDTDYDDIYGDIVIDDRIFYTFGYGVENDILNSITVPKVVSSMIPSNQDRLTVGNTVWDHICETIRLERRSLVSDQMASSKGGSTLDRAKPVGVLDIAKIELPIRFRRKPIIASLVILKDKPVVRICVGTLQAKTSSVPAHLMFEIVYHSIIEATKHLTDVKYSKDVIRNFILSFIEGSFYQNLDDDVRDHYVTLSARNIMKYSTS